MSNKYFSFVTYVKFRIEKTLSAETFCFLEKRLLPIFKFRPSSNLLSFYEMLIGPQPTFLEWLARVVQKVDSAIRWINLYPVDSAIGFPNTYPLDNDLSGG